jgi:hypothetical protein
MTHAHAQAALSLQHTTDVGLLMALKGTRNSSNNPRTGTSSIPSSTEWAATHSLQMPACMLHLM